MVRSRFIASALMLCLAATQVATPRLAAQASKSAQAKPAAAGKKLPPAEVDGLMAPVALYPDQLLAQMLMAATTPARVADLDKWLKTKPPFKGTALQDAAKQTGFEPSLLALVLFPQVVDFMTVNLDWTTEVGRVFTGDRPAVLDSVQRLRRDALKNGKLKSSPQQDISLKTIESGEQVIVIEPANPQVVYVPQYDTQTVYTQAPTTTTVVIKEESNDNSAAVAAGVIGFTAGIVIGASMNNDYYYGPYGYHGGPYMYNNAWNDYYDDRQDAREDWYDNRDEARDDLADHREDMAETRGDRASSTQQQRTDRQQTRQETGTTARSGTASGASASTQSAGRASQAAGRSTTGQAATAGTQSASSGSGSYEARGKNSDSSSTAAARSGTKSDAFSGYSSGKSERSASARGQQSRSSGGGGRSGGGRSGGGGGRRK